MNSLGSLGRTEILRCRQFLRHGYSTDWELFVMSFLHPDLQVLVKMRWPISSGERKVKIRVSLGVVRLVSELRGDSTPVRCVSKSRVETSQ